MKGIILCQTNQNWTRRWRDLHDGVVQTGDSLQPNYQAKRAAVPVYVIISRSAHLLRVCPRESTSICTFVSYLIFLASEKAFKDFFFPERMINSFCLCHVLDFIEINHESRNRVFTLLHRLPKFTD